MLLSRQFKVMMFVVIAFALFIGACGQKKESHWGQDLREDKNWWKKEGQSWDRETNIFMTVGYSNPSWKHEYDQRKSADLDARAQVAAFMNSLTKNYMEEVRSHNFTISESAVQSSADETILGSAIVSRKKKSGRYMSLVKVDLGYFFAQVYKKYRSDMENQMRRKYSRMGSAELDQIIDERIETQLDKLKTLEEPAVEKSIDQQ